MNICQSFLLQHCSEDRMWSGWAPQRGYGLRYGRQGSTSRLQGQQAVDTGVSAQHQASSFQQPAWIVVWYPINPCLRLRLQPRESVGSMRKVTKLSSYTGPSHQLRKEHTVQPGPMELREGAQTALSSSLAVAQHWGHLWPQVGRPSEDGTGRAEG